METDKSPYIDGFVFPVLRNRLEDYAKVAQSVADIYREYGAIEYREFVGDEMARPGIWPFPEMVNAADNEAIVFGWIVYESREARDRINAKIEVDPRMAEWVAPLMDGENPVFNPARMAYGGFKPLVNAS